MKHTSLSILAAATFAVRAVAQLPGTLDAGFAPAITGANEVVAVAPQMDWKLNIGGRFQFVNGLPARPNLARLLGSGSTESAAGFFTGDGPNDEVTCFAVQADGKILIGGGFSSVQGQPRQGLARLLPDGTVESLATFNPSLTGGVLGLALDSDGGIIAVGTITAAGGSPAGRIVKLKPDGTRESTANFNAGSGANEAIRTVALQADGRILIGGDFSTVNGQTREGLARLKAGGALETPAEFSPGALAGGGADVLAIAVQPDGKILLGGRFTSVGGRGRSNLARLDAAGTLESIATFNAGSGPNSSVQSIALQADGGIIIGGLFSSVNGQARAGIARLSTTGALESTFSSSGVTGEVRGISLQRDGRVLLCGSFSRVQGQPRQNLARLLNGAPQDLVFVTDVARTGVRWSRSGGVPELSQVQFDLSTDGGASWVSLGGGVKVAGGWELNGLNLPESGLIRGRARSTGGQYNGSSTVLEQVGALPRAARPVLEQPLYVPVGEGHSRDFGRVAPVTGTPASLTFALRNEGNANLHGTEIRITGPDADAFSLDGTVPALLAPTATAGFSIRFSPKTTGPKTATLTLTAVNDPPIVLTASLTGTGGPAGLFDSSFAPAFDGFGLKGVTVQPDGKILCWGRFTRAGSPQNTVGGIVRLLPGGELESSATFNPGTGFNVLGGTNIEAVSLQQDGRILVAGNFTSFNGQPRRNLLRLRSDGTLEASGGFNPGAGPEPGILASAIQRDGKILLAGYFTQFDGQPRGHIARLLPGGELESTGTFNTGTGADNNVFAVAVQEDGKILVAGAFDQFNGEPRRALARLHPDGSLESEATFHPEMESTDIITSAVVTPEGRILITGFFPAADAGAPPRFRIAALRPDGSFEGPETWNPGTGPDNSVHALTVQADGKILITGVFTRVDGQPRMRLARLLPGGAVESLETFDPGGGLDGPPHGIVQQPDGRILVTGNFYNVDGTPRKWLARFYNEEATEQVEVADYRHFHWRRGGGSPQIGGAVCELSTDDGASWSPLGAGQWDTGIWRWNGMALPAAGRLRFRGRTEAGLFNGGNSSGLVESTAAFSLQPEIGVSAGSAVLADGQTGIVDFGRQVQGTPGSQSLTVANPGGFPLRITGVSLPPGFSLRGLTGFPVSVDVASSLAFDIQLTSLQPGTHSGSVTITSDDLDEAEFDFPVTGEVFIPDPVASVPASTTALNRQTGLREQTVRITNDTTATVPAYNFIIRDLPEGVEVNNASERRADGSWVVYVRQPMNPHSTQDILLEYFSANRGPGELAPQLSTEVVLNPPDLPVEGDDAFAIDRVHLLEGGAVLIEFPTVPGRQYQVQYSHNGTHWQASLPNIRAVANRTQWLDRGLPRTDSHPSGHASRFYRVAELAP